MKTKTRNILIITAFAVAIIISFAAFGTYTYSSKHNSYKETADGYGIASYKSISTEDTFTVPDTYEGKPVTEIMAFSFANSEYLKELYIGANIRAIDIWALTNCPLLEKISVDDNNPYFSSVDGVLYNKDQTELLCYPNGKTPLETDKDGNVTGGGTLVLPDTVVSIRTNAFYMCTNLYGITFNEGLKSVGDKAFLKCGNLQEINLPSTVETIGTDAFSYCNAVKTLEIPASVTSIGDYAFFSTSTQMEKIVVHKASEADLTLGKDWIPNQANSVNTKIPVEYVGA